MARISKADADALRYSGFLGHQYASVATQDDGTVRVTGEYSTAASANAHAEPNARVYVRTRNKTWRQMARK